MARMFTYVDEETYSAINKIADKEHLSASSLISSVLKSYVKDCGYEEDTENTVDDDEDGVAEGKRIRVWIDEETVPVLNEKANSIGLSNTAYIRNLIHTKDFKIYRVGINDIEELIEEVHRSNTLMSSCVSLIRRYGLEVTNKNEINTILENSNIIKNLLAKTVATLYSNRRTAQQKMINQGKE